MDAESLLIRTHCVTLVRIYLNVCTARTSTITLTCVLHRWLGCQELGDTLAAMLRGTVQHAHDVATKHYALYLLCGMPTGLSLCPQVMSPAGRDIIG